ncbi:MAG: ice-binding family protein [Lysobacterales bacterium]
MLSGLALATAMAVSGGTLLAAGPASVDLRTPADFGALAGAAISGTGHVNGDVGSGTGAIAPAITSNGTIYPTGDAVVMTALDDFSTAYADGMNRPHDILLSAGAYELGGKSLAPGVYRIGGAATLATPITLNANGDPDAVFIIQIVGAFSSAASVGNVVLINDARSSNVFWVVEGAVAMGASTRTEGTILGAAAIAFGANSTISGRLMAGSAAGTIAIDTTTISVPVEPSLVGGRIWLDSNGDGIQDPTESTGFSGVPVTLLQLVPDGLTIELGTAANFGALAVGAISGTGHVEQDVGSGAGAIAPAITSDGTIYPTGNAVATTSLTDASAAYTDGKNRSYNVLLSAAAFELGGTTLTPGVYKIGAAATLASPVTLDAEGDPQGVFILQIVGALGATASVGNVILMNEAQSANIFWIVEGAVSMGANTHMEGTILGGAAISFGAGTNTNGRLLVGSAAGAIALDTTTISLVTGDPPIGNPPPIAVADTVTDAGGNYLFENVLPGIYIVAWDLTSVSTDFRITSNGVSGDVGGFVNTADFEVQGGTAHLDVDLGLVPIVDGVFHDGFDLNQ